MYGQEIGTEEMCCEDQGLRWARSWEATPEASAFRTHGLGVQPSADKAHELAQSCTYRQEHGQMHVDKRAQAHGLALAEFSIGVSLTDLRIFV